MTFFSLAQVTTLLGIDAKTLHRWLADAQIPLQCHPRDGRKKGVCDEQLQVLARLHHRSVASLPQESPVPIRSSVPPLPAALLALPEALAVLQAQVAALQQQVADLTALLKPQLHQHYSRTCFGGEGSEREARSCFSVTADTIGNVQLLALGEP